ncbi:hypothetical protein BKA58DRAFT_398371 [Alternaria rosae]|uniref:uncharacterized protein n=1 Tax=Alternaria rosae TaxID=1187941 RepID=UPI001E8D639B|nr:uncharacterized protein BKA58DRAFT_398371 [Alternaria rosae]KAH6878303.1 hypothetical protein BKA58DRAFT_398371 [Alternaria rosae]
MHIRLLGTFEAVASYGHAETAVKQLFRSQRQQQHASKRSAHVRALMITDASSLRGLPHRRRNFFPQTTSTPPLSRQRQHHLQAVGSLLILLREILDLMLEVAIFRPSLGRRSFISDARRRHKTLHPPRQQHDDHTRQRRPEKATWSLKRLLSPFAAPAGSCDIDRGGGQSSEGISAAMTRPATPPQRSTNALVGLTCNRDTVVISTSPLPRRANQQIHPAYRSQHQLATESSSHQQQFTTLISISTVGQTAAPRAESLPLRRTTDDTAGSSLSMYTPHLGSRSTFTTIRW